MKRAPALALLLACSGLAGADYHRPQTVLPLYSVSYHDPGVAALRRQRLADEVRMLRAEVLAIRQALTDRQPASFRALVTARCASCHTEGQLKGTRIVLLARDGQLAAFSPAQEKKIVDAVQSDHMPKGGPPLTPHQKRLVKETFFPKGERP